jgi:hypothetical protein
VLPGRALTFPRDHGAHPGARIEWWYATGWLQAGTPGDVQAPLVGFQVTFFRSRTGVGDAAAGRFAPRQLLFAHAAITDVAAGRHRHAQRIARWSGDEALPDAHARRADTAVVLVSATSQREGPKAPKDQQEPRLWRVVVSLERDGGQIKMSGVDFV